LPKCTAFYFVKKALPRNPDWECGYETMAPADRNCQSLKNTMTIIEASAILKSVPSFNQSTQYRDLMRKSVVKWLSIGIVADISLKKRQSNNFSETRNIRGAYRTFSVTNLKIMDWSCQIIKLVEI
jgi:hypothetical protein